MSQPPELLEVGVVPGEGSPPRHGFQGDRGAAPARRPAPLGLAIALSRESGARGGTIGRLVGKRLGWQVYDQELLEYMSQDAVARQGLWDNLSPPCLAWVEGRLAEMRRGLNLDRDEGVHNLARLVLAVAAQGEVVLIGRGAGCILPRATTLNARVVAPLGDRVAYMGQWLRLTTAEAAEKVRLRDERRAEFVTRHFRISPADVHQYDLVLNSSLLGEESCAELLAQAARLRWEQFAGGQEPGRVVGE
jgi:cytidylate kinase